MKQNSLLSYFYNQDTTQALRDASAAIEQVDANANPDWKEAAYETLIEVAKKQPKLTSTDVFDAMNTDATTHEPRAMGPIFMRASKAGIIEFKNEFIRCRRRHATPIRVWESKLYQEE